MCQPGESAQDIHMHPTILAACCGTFHASARTWPGMWTWSLLNRPEGATVRAPGVAVTLGLPLGAAGQPMLPMRRCMERRLCRSLVPDVKEGTAPEGLVERLAGVFPAALPRGGLSTRACEGTGVGRSIKSGCAKGAIFDCL